MEISGEIDRSNLAHLDDRTEANPARNCANPLRVSLPSIIVGHPVPALPHNNCSSFPSIFLLTILFLRYTTAAEQCVVVRNVDPELDTKRVTRACFLDSRPPNMYLPRNLIAHLYQNLTKRNHASAPPVLLLVALEPDALCACRILTALLKRDFIPHKIKPIAGYGDLARASEELVRPMRTSEGGSGGVVVCLGVGGMVDMEETLGLDVDENGKGGPGDVEVWIMDARRPWNLSNVFGASAGPDPQTGDIVRRQTGVDKGRLTQSYQSGRGGIIVFDDGDIEEELEAEREAYCALEEMPEVGEDAGLDDESDDPDDEALPESGQAPKKRKSWGDEDESMDDDSDSGRPQQRRRSNSVCSYRVEQNTKLTEVPGRFNTINTRSTSKTRPDKPSERPRRIIRFLEVRLTGHHGQSISITINSST
jgi:hypothetical protein